jgi:hypothetical protein
VFYTSKQFIIALAKLKRMLWCWFGNLKESSNYDIGPKNAIIQNPYDALLIVLIFTELRQTQSVFGKLQNQDKSYYVLWSLRTSHSTPYKHGSKYPLNILTCNKRNVFVLWILFKNRIMPAPFNLLNSDKCRL